MPISNDSKQSLRQEKARLEDIRAGIQKQIDELDKKRQILVSRKQEVHSTIQNLKSDIDNG